MELETINKLYLELSQVATAKTKREIDLEETATRRVVLLEQLYKEQFKFRQLLPSLQSDITKELALWRPDKYHQY